MKSPCDEAVIQTGAMASPCLEKSRPWILAAAILGSSMAFIDSTVVNVALPALQSGLHATVVDVQWIIESYGLFLSALILAGGALGDTFGRRAMFLLGVGTFAVSSAGCSFSSSIQALLFWRSLQGIAGAFLVPGSLAIVSSSFDEASRGRAIGTWAGFTTMTTALGPVLGGWLIDHASWHWVFFINVPFAAVVVAISLRHVPESRDSNAGRVDWSGAALVTLGLAGLVYGFLESPVRGWTNPLVIGGLTLGSLLLIAFVWVEKKSAAPMVPLQLFQSPSFCGANLLTLFLYSALGIFFFLYPLNLIQIQKYSATATGAAALPTILLASLLARWSGGLIARFGAKLPLVVGPLIVAAGFILFALPGAQTEYWKSFFPAFVVLGFCLAITVAPLTTVVMNSVGQERAGAASGINNAVARVAGVLAVAVLGVVMVSAFTRSLDRSLANSKVDPAIVHQLESNSDRLGSLSAPASADPHTSSIIRDAVAQAFVFGFRMIVLICAGLAVASAAIAYRRVPDNLSR
ncbi:MAG TPA: DHA2 family efflux MFS transporter permease subunit [Candidatus Binatia bacterium]|nr:DHA2 family efflux MFS transporter permease subunit [Candidatus Binatia bacterium]